MNITMEDCAEALKKWKALRRLALRWDLSDQDQWSPDIWETPGRAVLLDIVEPPVHRYDDEMSVDWERMPRFGVPHCYDELLSKYPGILDLITDQIPPALRETFGDDFDLEANAQDRRVLMNAWESRHSQRVAAGMRHLARSCPMLEQIEWYPVGSAPNYDEERPVRWLWEVHREKESQEVRSVTGELTFTGCMQGDPPPFYILVGEELKRALSEWQRGVWG